LNGTQSKVRGFATKVERGNFPHKYYRDKTPLNDKYRQNVKVENTKAPLTLHPLPQGERQIRKDCHSGLDPESRFLLLTLRG